MKYIINFSNIFLTLSMLLLINLNTSKVQAQENSSQESNRFFLKNDCIHPLKFALRYRQLNGDWETASWFNFSANEGSLLKGIYVNNKYFYYYAETTDSSNINWSGDRSDKIDGKNIKMRETKIIPEDGKFSLSLSCKKTSTNTTNENMEAKRQQFMERHREMIEQKSGDISTDAL